MPQISKKQFIVLAFVVILITVFVIVSIVNGRNNTVNQSESNSDDVIPNASDNIPTPSQPINIPDNADENENNNNNETNLEPEETNIDTGAQDLLLLQMQKRIEIAIDKNSELIFTNMFSPTPAQIEEFIGVDLSKFDSYMVRMSENKFSTELYMIFKPFADYKEIAKAQIKRFLLSYESAWSKLSEEQYQLIKDRTAVEKNGYIIYIISIDNNTIMNEIRKFI